MSIKFSCIVPIYNVENYLERCLNSLLKQDYINYEVILIDDGSTDTSGKIVDEYAKKSSIFKVIHKVNEGLGETRNVGLRMATGDYIIFVDSDDWVENTYLSEISKIIIETKADIVHCSWYEDTEISSKLNNDVRNEKLEKGFFLNKVLIDDIGCQVWKNVYKKALWRGITFPRRLYEDLYTTHLVIDRAQNIVQIKNAYYHYIIRNNNISNSFNPIKGRDIFYGFVSRYEFMKNHNMAIPDIILSKIYKNGIQAIHGISLIKDYAEIKKITKYILLNNREGGYINSRNQIEIFMANKFTRLYVYSICFFYKYIRRNKICV